MSARLLLLTTIGVMSTILLLGACGGDQEVEAPSRAEGQKTEKATSATTPDPGKVETETADAEQPDFMSVEDELRAQVEIPSFYPEDGPIYPGVEPSRGEQLPDGRVSLMFGTDALADEASDVMVEAAEARGWTIHGEDVVDRGRLVRAEKDGRQLMILTNRVEGGSSNPVTLVAVVIEP